MIDKQRLSLFLSFFFLINRFAFAQPEAAIWYFGAKAGLDFKYTPPKPLLNGQMNSSEGGTAIADENGELLFYTDGIRVWNKKHQIINKDRDLLGHTSATQSGIIVPMPANKGKYYVFTVDAEAGENGVCYSIIDMTTDTLGIITENNTNILKRSTEKITAVSHANGKDIWILAHGWESDNFHAYLLNSKGLTKKPVISKIGVVHGGVKGNAVGFMKLSPNGKKLAAAIKKLDYIELLDFDAVTGKLSNPLIFELGARSFVYGVEFSSDNTKLYVTSGARQQLYQINLSEPTPEKMRKSLQLIAHNETWCGALQLAPDGKIYLALDASDYLGVINKPNQLGKACDYKEKGILLGKDKYAKLNLPSFVQNYFYDKENLSKIQNSNTLSTKIGGSFYKNILFEIDKYNVMSDYYKDLDDLVEYLKLSKQIKIEIIGHTDNDGTAQKNLLLSKNRAKSVAKYLIIKGIDTKRIKSRGVGQTKPIATNVTEQGKAQNRRIEFMLKR